MLISTNNIIDQYYDKLNEKLNDIIRIFDIKEYLNFDIFEINGLYILKEKVDIIDNDFINLYANDYSYLEWNVNDIYINDIFEAIDIEGIPKILFLLYCGDQVLNHLAQKLDTSFKNVRFKIILDLDDGDYPNTKVRFYKIRNGEKDIVDKNLSNYKINGIKVIDI